MLKLAIIFTIALMGLLSALPARAESGPLGFGPAEFNESMETDRPDFTEGTQTITPGHLQVELGYTFTYDSASDLNEHGVPESLLRIGILSETELRLGWDGYRHEEIEDVTADGFGDMSIGFKQRLLSSTDSNPSLSFIGELALPTGSHNFSSEEVVPEIKFLGNYDLSPINSISSNINFSAPREDDDRYFETAASLAWGHELNSKWGSYLEYFGLFPNRDAPESAATNYINGGFTYALTDSMQFDILAGFGLNDSANDFFTGCGFSFRI